MRHILTATATLFFSISAAAQTATLKINSDLMIHPAQVTGMFTLAADQVNQAPSWEWADLSFEQPYKTAWSQVQAVGPFSFKVDADKTSAQEATFEFGWNEPTVNVGRFTIKDTIVRDIGGAQIVVNLEGVCSGMKWKVSGGNWKVRGRVSWAIANSQLVVQWKEFEFTNGPASGSLVADMGQCQGPPEIMQALKDSVAQATSDANVMSDLLRRGILAWMNESLSGLRHELLKTRIGAINEKMDLTWEPQVMIMLSGGIIRIPGYVWLKKQGANVMPAVVDRTLSEQDFSSITDSGFVLPTNAFEAVTAFTHSTGDLHKRYRSTEIEGFHNLMQNWFLKFFFWPDLNRFASNTLFYFDLFASGKPELTNPRQGSAANGGGILYDTKAPILINTYAPANGAYVNYVDFRGTVQGTLRASIKNQQLIMGAAVSTLPLTSKYRSEFKAIRWINEWIDSYRLGKSGMDFINGKTYVTDLPKWELGSSMQMVYGDLKPFKQSIMLPLSFQKK